MSIDGRLPDTSRVFRKGSKLVVAGATLIAAIIGPCLSLNARAGEALSVNISGLSGELLDNVEAALSLRRRGDEDLSVDAIKSLHLGAESEIRRALQPFGYYAPSIHSELRPPGTGQPGWVAEYRIDRGAPVIIGRMELRLRGPGAGDEGIPAFAATLPVAEGQLLRHMDYERAKLELLTEIHNRGYRDAELAEHRVEVDVAAASARVILAIDTGPRYTVGDITFEQGRFAEDYLRKYLILEPGQLFSTREIARQRRLLIRSAHFQEVQISEGERDAGEPSRIPLVIRLTPFPANRYRAQLGWGTDTGAGIQGDWNRRHIGRQGHRFTLGASAVEDQSRLAGDLRYSIPSRPLTGEGLELGLRYQSRTLKPGDVELDQGGETRIVNSLVSASWRFSPSSWNGFQLSTEAALSAVQDSYDIFELVFGNLSAESQQAIADAIGEEALNTLAPDFEAVVPSLRLTARRAGESLFIGSGDYFRLELLATDTALGSNVNFWQARFNSWTIRPLGASGRIVMRTAAGYSDVETREVLGASFNQIPELYEFRAGGARSVRGYQFERLIPEDAVTGGKHQLLGSVEYQHEIIEDISLAAFVDAGNAFNDWDNIDEKYGVGLGVHWRSPVGAVRLDLAVPLDDAEDAFQVYVTVGPEF